ncbi:MAG: hypothetical protein AAF402_11510 [Pseudomonadota bacterium]
MAITDDHGKIRLYKLNSKGQEVRQKFVGNQGESGCFDFRIRRDAVRFAQLGYEYCELFSKKSCESNSQIEAMWTGSKYRVVDIDITKPQLKIYRGAKWQLSAEGNIKVASWRCQY